MSKTRKVEPKTEVALEAPKGKEIELTLESLKPSKKNPGRESLDKIEDLIKSIRERGLLQNLTARKLKGSDNYEIVCGRRRLAALQFLAKEDPKRFGKVRVLTFDALDDKAAEEMALVENLQRENLRPVEEAKGYADLSRTSNVDEIAAKTGMPKARIISRLQLLGLPPKALEAIEKEELPLTHAIVLARIHDKADREKAAAEVLREIREGRLASVSALRGDLLDHYTRNLGGVPWKIDAEHLKPEAAGACAHCQYNTANQREMFPDAWTAKDARCNNPRCFEERTLDAARNIIKKAKEEGHKVLKGTGAAKALRDDWDYKPMGENCWEAGNKTFGQMVDEAKESGQKIKLTIAIDPGTGKAVKLLERSVADALVLHAKKSKKKAKKSPEEKRIANADRKRKVAAEQTIAAAMQLCQSCGADLEAGLYVENEVDSFFEMLVRFEILRANFDVRRKLIEDLIVQGETDIDPKGDEVEQLLAWFKRTAEKNPSGWVGKGAQLLLKAFVLSELSNFYHRDEIDESIEEVLVYMGTSGKELVKKGKEAAEALLEEAKPKKAAAKNAAKKPAKPAGESEGE